MCQNLKAKHLKMKSAINIPSTKKMMLVIRTERERKRERERERERDKTLYMEKYIFIILG